MTVVRQTSLVPGRRARDRAPIVEADTARSPIRDLVCFSHLRWDFVYQRPQHLLSRFAAAHRVFFVEEPVHGDVVEPMLDVTSREAGLRVVIPRLPHGCTGLFATEALQSLLTGLLIDHEIERYLAWYYTPMALAFSRHLHPEVIVYDCMDELSGFRGAPPDLLAHEQELLARADVVFTGGQSLFEAKRHRHPDVHAFPSSIDRSHFERARHHIAEPADQRAVPGPRVGFAGVIDERMDLALLREVAERRPQWHFVLLGPVVKIDPATLPRLPNLHYLGQKAYGELPDYMAHWDAAMLPFAHNDATRFISPTKTPEYLAAGRPVVSTGIRDVVRPYGELGLVRIADGAEAFAEALAAAIEQDRNAPALWRRVDEFLAQQSWDRTWNGMVRRIAIARRARLNRRRHRTPEPPGHERRKVALEHNGFPVRYHDRRSDRPVS